MCNYKKWGSIVASWLVFVLAITFYAETSLAETKAGIAETVSNLVFGVLRGDQRPLSKGSDVFTDQAVRTGSASGAELRLLDETSISMGPESEITLDRFVYDPNRGQGNVILNTTRGVFRFASGKQDSSSYHINTPVATIGVRGTKIEIELTDDPKCIRNIPAPGTAASTKKMTLLLVSGKTEARLPNGDVVSLNEENTVVDICAGGGIQGPRQWVGKLSLFDTARGVTGSFAGTGFGAGGGGGILNTTSVGAHINSNNNSNSSSGGGKQETPLLTFTPTQAGTPVSHP